MPDLPLDGGAEVFIESFEMREPFGKTDGCSAGFMNDSIIGNIHIWTMLVSWGGNGGDRVIDTIGRSIKTADEGVPTANDAGGDPG